MNSRYFFSVLIVLLVTGLSLFPAQEFPEVDVQFADKWAHWIMYAAVTLIIGIEQGLKRPVRAWGTRIAVIAVFAALWGALMELCQAYLTTTRSGDILDAAANTFGALCGAMVLLLLYKTVPRMKNVE
ncbi:MAG: VanZ family protein [Bacteroidaceae bacterium]|nr:VanZ family protein [Bacteroidaceae bacterium]